MPRGDDASATGRSRWPLRCSSCDERLHGPYCSACGESHRYTRLELPALVEDVLDRLLELDTRVLRTIGELSVAPARVCRDYLDGRRVRYIHPFKYALATFALVYAIAELSTYLHGPPSDPQMALVLRWGPLLTMLAMPVLAMVMMPLFANAPRKLTWVEHDVVVLYSLGHVALLQSLLNPMVTRFEIAGVVVFGLLPLAFSSWVAVGVYETRWWTTVPRVIVGFAIMWLVIGGGFWLLT